MHKYIALLRAINVGGHNVKMDVLKSHFRALGFSGVETLLASGNVIFDSEETDRERIATQIAHYLEARLGYPVATFIRTPSEFAEVVDYEPFNPLEIANAGAFSVAFMARPLDKTGRALLAEFVTDIDKFHTHGCEVYWMCAIKQSDSKFSNAAFEKKLGVAATFRSIKTIQRLAAKYAEHQTR